jgi:hypothetical protein
MYDKLDTANVKGILHCCDKMPGAGGSGKGIRGEEEPTPIEGEALASS